MSYPNILTDAASWAERTRIRRECEEIIRSGQGKIVAIKHARNSAGLPLKDAKDWVETFHDAALLPRGFVDLPLKEGITTMRTDRIEEVCDNKDGCTVWIGGTARFVALPRLSVLALIAKAQQS